MKRGDVLAVTTNSTFGRAISYYTKEPYNHIAVAKNDKEIFDFCLNSKEIFSIDDYFSHKSIEKIDVIETYFSEEVMRHYEHQFQLAPYSFSHINRLREKILLGRDQEDISRWGSTTCCSLYLRAHEKAKTDLARGFPYHNSQITPGGLVVLLQHGRLGI